MSRTILVHFHVEVPDGDSRSVDDIAASLSAAIEVGSDDESVEGLEIALVLAEEI